MTFIELFIIAVGLSMDAFAVSICIGLANGTANGKATVKDTLTVGGYFGGSQGVMPLIGYLIAGFFAKYVLDYGHFVAFAVIAFLGVRMVASGFQSKMKKAEKAENPKSLTVRVMLPLAIATSIDAMAVGVSFAFVQVNIAVAAALITAVTFAFAAVGIRLGSAVGTKSNIGYKAELLGGVILLAIGTKILIEGILA